jgi:hypothetical protein
MKLKSTGLGPMELHGDLKLVEKKMTGIYLLLEINDPVLWKVRVFIQKKDLRKLPFLLLNPKNVWFIIKGLLSKTEEKQSEEA